MSKHTPGPWKVEDRKIRSFDIFSSKGENIAVVKDIPRNLANARLIAAAPEMHDFLRDILEARGIDEHGLATLKDFFDNLNGGKNGTP